METVDDIAPTCGKVHKNKFDVKMIIRYICFHSFFI